MIVPSPWLRPGLDGTDVGVVYEFLDIIELVTGFFQAVGKGGAQGVGGGAFGDASRMDGGGDSSLNTAGVQVMLLDSVGAGVYREVTRGEHILPFPGFVYGGIFTGQSGGHRDRDIEVSVVVVAYPLEMSAQALQELPVIGQESHPVAIGLDIVDGDEKVLEVQVFNSQTQGFEQPQTAAVEETGDEIGRTVQFSQDVEAFVMVEVGLDIGAFLGAGGVQIVERNTKHVLVEE